MAFTDAIWHVIHWLIDQRILDLNMNIHGFLEILHEILRNLNFEK